jgi:hypothetical protein
MNLYSALSAESHQAPVRADSVQAMYRTWHCDHIDYSRRRNTRQKYAQTPGRTPAQERVYCFKLFIGPCRSIRPSPQAELPLCWLLSPISESDAGTIRNYTLTCKMRKEWGRKHQDNRNTIIRHLWVNSLSDVSAESPKSNSEMPPCGFMSSALR